MFELIETAPPAYEDMIRTVAPYEIARQIEDATGCTCGESSTLYANSRDTLRVPYAPDCYPDFREADAQRIVKHAVDAYKAAR